MQEIILEIINQFGYLGVFLLITIENLFPPIPSEIILTFSGFMTIHSTMNIWGVIIAATLGSVIGAVILYFLGSILKTQYLEKFFDSKLGKLLHLKKDDVKKAEGWFIKHGNKAILFCRFVPVVRSLISIPAGTARIGLKSFLPLTVIGTFIWNVILVFLGRIAGDAWEIIADYADIYSMAIIIFFMMAAVVIIMIFIKKRFLFKEQTDRTNP